MKTTFLPLALVVGLFAGSTTQVNADAFDHYLNASLAKLKGSKHVREVKKLTPDLILDHDRVLRGLPGTFVVVQTNQGRLAKLLVRDAQQKVNDTTRLPIFLIERYTTYKIGEERTIHTRGQNLSLFAGFRFSLDLGQVVPKELGGDLQLVVDKDEVYVQPLDKARLFVVTRALAGVEPKKGTRLVVGKTFEPRYFNGTFNLYDDGRRSGTLKLQVDKTGAVTGAYYSGKDGRKYEVTGKLGTPKHAVVFTIKFPRTEQVFQGMLFTGNARALAGTSQMLDHKAAFYAVRVEQ